MKITKHNYKYIILDAIIIFASLYIALILRFGNDIPPSYSDSLYTVIPFLVAFKVFAYFVSGIYSIWWRKASVNEAFKLAMAIVISSIILWVVFIFFRFLPLSIFFISLGIELIFTGLVRFIERYKELYFIVTPFIKDESQINKDIRLHFYVKSIASLHKLSDYGVNVSDGFFDESLNYLEKNIYKYKNELQARIERAERQDFYSPSDWYFLMNYNLLK